MTPPEQTSAGELFLQRLNEAKDGDEITIKCADDLGDTFEELKESLRLIYARHINLIVLRRLPAA